MSFFNKLKNSVGIEEEEEMEQEEEKKDTKPAKKGKKVQVQAKKEEPEEQEWFEPEGELAVDVYKTEGELVIQSTIAGVKPEDLDITIENDVVTITGERPNPTEDEEKNYFYQECYWGPFSRQIILPEEVDTSKIEASMKDGVFTLRLPTIERQKVKKVKIKG